jgi:hypothetical protein
MQIRTTIRTATAALLAGATDAGPRVYRRRTPPVPSPETPFLLVHVAGEAAAGDGGMSVPKFQHDLTLTVEAVVSGTDEAAEDALDALCGQVLDRLLTDPSWVRSWSRIVTMDTGFPAPGRLVRDPGTGTPLPAEGRQVPSNQYWHHRLAAGDVLPADTAGDSRTEE